MKKLYAPSLTCGKIQRKVRGGHVQSQRQEAQGIYLDCRSNICQEYILLRFKYILTLVEVNKLAQKKMMQKMVAKSRAVIAQNDDVDELSEEELSFSNRPQNKRQSKRQKPKRQYLRSNAQRDSSSDQDQSMKLSKQQSMPKKIKIDEFKQENNSNMDLEFQNLLSQLSQSKPDYQIVVYKLRKILNEFKNKNLSTENILEILKNNRGKILNTIYKILNSKSEQFLEDYRSLFIRQLLDDLKQFIDVLKNELLKLYFDSNEILQYLDQVTKSFGEKKIIKLFDKLQNQKDEFLIDEEEVHKSAERSQSESWESQNLKQSSPTYNQEQTGFKQKRQLRSKQPLKQAEGPQQKKPKREYKQPRQKSAQQRTEPQKKSNVKSQSIDQIVHNDPHHLTIIHAVSKEVALSSQQTAVNVNLRKRVCFKMLDLLQSSYNMDKQKAQEITLKLELRARKHDSQMGQQYKSLIKNLISGIKVQNSIHLKNRLVSLSLLQDYNQQKEETRDSSLWDLIIQSVQKVQVDIELTQGLKSIGLGSVSQEDHQTDIQNNEKHI